MKRAILQTKLCAFALLALLAAFSAPVAAQHETHNMPGVSKPKPKPKPKPRPAPAKRKQAAQTKPKQDDASEADNAETPEPQPQPAPSPTPAAKPADVHKHEPLPSSVTTTPQPAPEKTETNSVAPQPAPSPKANQAQPAGGHKHDMSNMETSGAEGKTDSSNVHGSMPGMAMGTMAMDPNSLVLMSGEEMEVCIGPGTKNTLSMGQMGSGSSWQPQTTPMHMWTQFAGKWVIFYHADLKLGVNSQGGPRGVTKFESQNWIMPMAFRRAGPGTLQLRGMFSLEPFSLARGGSPQLFQTGETYQGRALVDKQHPHDLFMELSATYTVPVGEHGTWFAYLGYPGEPSLGPTTFMHRISASENPTAPLAHHIQDSTHISFGVFSTGFTYRGLKLEGSIFNGREPDEDRYDLEYNPWNSRSVRLSFAPNANWSMQVSHGFLRNPEALAEGDIRRTTASVSYNRRFARGNWATTLVWGRNHGSHEGEAFNQNGYTAESTLNFLDKNYIYARLELVDKNELLSAADRALLGITEHHPSFRIGAYTFGFARDIWNKEKFSMALGSDLTFYSKPDRLDAIYGANPVSYKFFVRIRPGKMSMNSGQWSVVSGQ
ncbi:MAG TPA: hypothetical protein VF791_08075 [Pyrinomonadaceae bacterium]